MTVGDDRASKVFVLRVTGQRSSEKIILVCHKKKKNYNAIYTPVAYKITGIWSTLIKSGITVSFPVRAQSMRHNLIFADPSKAIHRHQNDVNQC